ncbi:unnamed protein product [Ceutorhynchus assimilis]|uniref:Uncharacterized protein n=1 Tax=Ceutorhynchus assimilis TaxID=467358 RepID=A0A9N9MYQ5_9CUCU|nr:unnamed protein product [Ceutorhynchus assimilis]
MVAVATWQGMKVYNHYKQRPVIVTVDKSYYKWNIEYPTVTICTKQLKNEDELRQEIETLSFKYNWPDEILTTEYDDFVSYLEDLAFKNYKNYDEYKPYATNQKKEYLKPEQYMEVLNRVVFDINYTERKMKHQKFEPVKVIEVVPKSIERVFTERGLCYVVNSNVSRFYTPE